MGIEHKRPQLLAVGHERFEGFCPPPAHQGQGRQPGSAPLAYRLDMPEQVVAPALAQGIDTGRLRLGQEQLQVGPAGMVGAPMEGGVVPAEFPQGQAGARRSCRHLPAHAAPQPNQPGRQGFEGIGSGPQQQAVLASSWRRTGRGPGHGRRHRSLQQGDGLQQQGRLPQLARRSQGPIEALKTHHQLLPGHRLGGGEAQGRDDAVGAIGVVERFAGRPIQTQQPGLVLHGHHLQAEHVAWIAQKPPAQGANPAGAPADEAPHRGAAVGAGHQAQSPALAGQLLVQGGQPAARLHLHHAGFGVDVAHPVQALELEHHPAGQGHALAVIARARPPQGEGHPMATAGPSHQLHLLHAGGQHGQLGAAALQLGHQHGRIVVKIPRQALQLCPANHQLEAGIDLGQFSGQGRHLGPAHPQPVHVRVIHP